MGIKEKEDLERALRAMTAECSSKEKATELFKADGYFDASGKLAKEFRESE